MRKKKWKLIVTDPDTGENEIVSDDNVTKYVCSKVGDGVLALIRKLPVVGIAALGVRTIYRAGQKSIKPVVYYGFQKSEFKDILKETMIECCNEVAEDEEA